MKKKERSSDALLIRRAHKLLDKIESDLVYIVESIKAKKAKKAA